MATLGLLLAFSFALATLASILLTDTTSRAATPSFLLSIAIFAVPLLLSTAALARWTEGGLRAGTGAFGRAARAVLLLLHGLFLADSGWALILSAAGVPNGMLHLRIGAAMEPLGALLVAAAGILSGFAQRAAVDTAGASG